MIGLAQPVLAGRFRIKLGEDINDFVTKNITGIKLDILYKKFSLDLDLFPNNIDFLNFFLELDEKRTRFPPSKKYIIPLKPITIYFLSGNGDPTGSLQLIKPKLDVFGIDFSYRNVNMAQPIKLTGSFNSMQFYRASEENE